MALWLQNLSAWVLSTFGITMKDFALLAGAILTIFALPWIGLYSGKPRYREAARFGWFMLIVAFAVIAWGLYNRSASS